MNGKWRVRDAKLIPLAIRARELFAQFPKKRIRHIPREENAVADLLANRAIDEAA
jgi:probable phosphoglycerate mutase